MRDQTRGDEDAPGPRRGQSSHPATAALPAASPSALSPTFSSPASTPAQAASKAPSAIDERRERRRKRRRRMLMWTTVVGIVVLVGSISTVSYAIVSNLAEAEPATEDPAPAAPAAVETIEFPQDEPAAAAGAQPCATVSVLSSFENAEPPPPPRHAARRRPPSPTPRRVLHLPARAPVGARFPAARRWRG